MNHPIRRLTHPAVPATLLAALVAVACGGGDDDPGLPRLSAASAGTFVGTCADLAGKLSGLANTAITSTTDVAAGAPPVAGQPVPAHCRVLGAMEQRTSTVDGRAYAIGFEMRPPLARDR